jgi:hypothetical protein
MLRHARRGQSIMLPSVLSQNTIDAGGHRCGHRDCSLHQLRAHALVSWLPISSRPMLPHVTALLCLLRITQIKCTLFTPIIPFRHVLIHCLSLRLRLRWPLQSSHPTANTASRRAIEKGRSQPTEQSHSRMLDLPCSKDQVQWCKANMRKL